MKAKYIITAIIALAFVALAYSAFDSSKIEYTDFTYAKKTGNTVQVTGSWDKSENYDYNAETNTFTFTMTDEKSNSSKVVYHGAKPNNFDIAPMVVIKGQFEDGIFMASSILTKCPSKYEADFEEIKKNAKV